MKLFPTVRALANAPEHDVLNAWEGLGYYSRARNLHKAAKLIMENYGGKLPRDLDELRKLPGVGRYTVGALASIVFGMDEPALDGNLKRVYARLFDVSQPVDSREGEKILWKLARENLPRGRAADFNQALMDLGAMVCLPKNPRCEVCPVKINCSARINGTQYLRPVKKQKKRIPHYIHGAAVIVRRGRVLLAQRPQQGLLAGMWEFPNARVEGDPARELNSALRAAYSLKVRVMRFARPLAIVEHAYSHFKVTVHAFRCEPTRLSIKGPLKWVSRSELDTYPMGKIDRQIAQKL
jgi:A/G-specific adenine glycosylase